MTPTSDDVTVEGALLGRTAGDVLVTLDCVVTLGEEVTIVLVVGKKDSIMVVGKGVASREGVVMLAGKEGV